MAYDKFEIKGEIHYIAHPDYHEDTYDMDNEQLLHWQAEQDELTEEEKGNPITGYQLINLIRKHTDQTGKVDEKAALHAFMTGGFIYVDKDGTTTSTYTLELRKWRGEDCWHFIEHLEEVIEGEFNTYNPSAPFLPNE